MSDVKAYVKRVAALVEQSLDRVMEKESAYPQSIHGVMRYSVFAGGKRIRPALMMAAFEACGGRFGDEKVLLAGAAFEMLHTFSLIHDDLPCMDDDDFRRGKPTAHRAFGEATAVLGGDALCIFAFECLSRTGRIDIIEETAKALGTRGMIGGQVVDVESEGRAVDRATVDFIHTNKTAAFIRAAVRCGVLFAGAPVSAVDRLTSYGNAIGLAFQIVDDILDEEGTTEQLGKDAGSDREKGKATYPAVVGMEESKRCAEHLIEQAHGDIAFLADKGRMLGELADYIRTRIN